MQKLTTILHQIADRSLSAALNAHMAPSIGFIWKGPIFKVMT
jgi:hypothetical protein